jgi:hypothetical protein
LIKDNIINLKTMLIEYFLEYMDKCQALGVSKEECINEILSKYDLDKKHLEVVWEMSIT